MLLMSMKILVFKRIKKKQKKNIGPSPVHVKTEEKKTQNIQNQLYQTKCS